MKKDFPNKNLLLVCH